MINPGRSYNINDYKEIFLRRKLYFVVPFVVIFTAAVLWAALAPRKYQASTLVLVTPQRVPTELIRPTVTAGILERLCIPNRHVLGYQSRTGPVKWIGPGTDEILRELGRYAELDRSLADAQRDATRALQAAVAGMQNVLGHLKKHGSLAGLSNELTSFEERQRLVQKPQFDTLEKKYS